MVNSRPSRFIAMAMATWLGCSVASSADEPHAPASSARAPSSARFEKDVVPFLARHCYSCHGGGKNKGELTLDKYRDVKELLKDREVWENVAEMVRTGEMPPKAKDRPRPDPSEAELAMKAIDEILDEFDCTGARQDGRVTIRRLNRAEYNNTIRDLVGVDFKPAADFPNDDVGYGFDNIGDVLSVSPLLLEKYLAAAEAILDRAIVIADPPKPRKERLGSPRASFGAGGQRRGAAMFLHGKGQVSGQIYLDEGDYTIRAEVFGQQLGDEPVRAALRVSGEDVKEFEVTATEANPATIEAKRPAQGRVADDRRRLPQPLHRAAEARRRAVKKPEPAPPRNGDPAPARRPRQAPSGVLVVRNISVDGPYNPPPPDLPETHRRIFAHRPDLSPREAAREIVARFADKAFRRPSRPEEVERLLKLYDKAEKEGERFEDRVRLALEGRPGLARLPVPRRAGPARPRARDELPRRRIRAGLAAVVLPLEQHARRRAVRPGGRGQVAAEPRRPGPPDARGPEVGRLRPELLRPVADDPEAGLRRPRPARSSPASTRNSGRRWSARPSCSSRRSSARIGASSTSSTPTSAS